LLEKQASGEGKVEQIDLVEQVRVQGVVSRQLAVESLSLVAAGLAQPGNPICELGLATSGQAIDIVATHDQSIRWRRLIRNLDRLFCPFSEPLALCKGRPPTLRGKQWFTFHEFPLSSHTMAALRELERSGQLQTLHVGAAYVN